MSLLNKASRSEIFDIYQMEEDIGVRGIVLHISVSSLLIF